jgi:hypothetical protein
VTDVLDRRKQRCEDEHNTREAKKHPTEAERSQVRGVIVAMGQQQRAEQQEEYEQLAEYENSAAEEIQHVQAPDG